MTSRPASGRHRGRFLLRGEEGSMMFYLLLAVVGLALGALAVPMIVTASTTTRSDVSRTHALDAAQAGVQVMLGQIRNAQSSSGVGSTAQLPCTSASGTANTTGAAAYSASVAYYVSDPSATPAPTAMRCVQGYGPYDSGTASFLPKYAVITSKGTDGRTVNGSTPGRTMVSTYTFKTSANVVLGGQLVMNATSVCMDAGSATPVAGTGLTAQTCASGSQQSFAFRTDLTLQLVSSVTTTYPNGLCIDTTTAPAVAATAVVLKACNALGSPPYNQQWSYDSNFQAAIATSSSTGTLSGLCIATASLTVGTALTMQTCGNGTYQQWNPTSAAGAGGAVAPQWVNYKEYGRCLDVTRENTSADHLIAYPCKSNPRPASINWNQRFTTPAIATGATNGVGQIYTTPTTTNYCLTSPGTEGGWVVLTVCSSTNASQVWTVYNGSSSLSYSGKFTWVDSSGRCAGLATKSGESWSAVATETCTGASDQKWNANSALTNAALTNVAEIANQ